MRLGARGNVTCIPPLWEDMRRELGGSDKERPTLPRTGAEVAYAVHICLKTSGSAERRENLKSIIHQARVRISVVVRLILDAQARRHPAYMHIDERDVDIRVAKLPVDDAPPELLRILGSDDSIGK